MTENASENETQPRFPFVLVDVAPDDVDFVSYSLFELGAQGVEERDESTLNKTSIQGKVTLSASFLTRQDADAAISELDAALSPRIEEIVGDGWRDAWKQHYKPFAVCEGLVVRPPWEPYEAKPAEKVLELEPGRAFGTGLHETTSLVAQSLAARRAEVVGKDVLDVGCGSGILSLVALSFGAERATAVDVDQDAVDVTLENAARNGMSARVSSSTTDIKDVPGEFPVVVANIEAGVLIPMSQALYAHVKPGGFLTLSGILLPQATDVTRAYEAHGGKLEAKYEKGEWVALVLRKPA